METGFNLFIMYSIFMDSRVDTSANHKKEEVVEEEEESAE